MLELLELTFPSNVTYFVLLPAAGSLFQHNQFFFLVASLFFCLLTGSTGYG